MRATKAKALRKATNFGKETLYDTRRVPVSERKRKETGILSEMVITLTPNCDRTKYQAAKRDFKRNKALK